MRILYFSRDYTTHDHRFLSALAQTEHKVYFLRLEKSEQAYEERPIPEGIEPIEWAGGKQPARLTDGLRLLDDLQRVLRQVKPDLVHAGPIQRSAFLVALTGFHPLVSMSWGYDLLYDVNTNPSWRWATRFTLAHSDALVGDCETIRNLAISYGMRKDGIVTFPWGIDLKHFKPNSLAQSNCSTFSLLSTRGFEPIYGLDVIARGFVIAARKRPELRLTLLGGGTQWAPIRQILLVGGVFEQVSFPGFIPFANLPELYCNADVYVCASHSDGTSISLLEALACGKPVIVSDIPGHREWITQGETGWLFTDGDPEAFASAILNAMDQRSSLPEMSRKARLLAESRADWQTNFPMLENAYHLAMGTSPARYSHS